MPHSAKEIIDEAFKRLWLAITDIDLFATDLPAQEMESVLIAWSSGILRDTSPIWSDLMDAWGTAFTRPHGPEALAEKCRQKLVPKAPGSFRDADVSPKSLLKNCTSHQI